MIDLATKAEGEDTVAALEALATLRRRPADRSGGPRDRGPGRHAGPAAPARGRAPDVVHIELAEGAIPRLEGAVRGAFADEVPA